MTIAERIKEYYINGYGFPKKYYSDGDLDSFAAKNIISADEAARIKAVKNKD